MKGADFPVSIDPNDHLAHHNILLKPPGFTNCQCLRTSNHLNIIKGTKGVIDETDVISRGKADLKHCKGCCDRVVVNCQRNWVALMNWVHSYQVSLFTEKISLLKKCIQPSAWRRASWSGKVQQGRQRYRRPPGFPHGRSHAGPAELSTPCITSSKSEPFRFNFSKPFPQRWCKDFPGRGTDSLSNTVQVFCKQVNINCPNAIFQIFWQN